MRLLFLWICLPCTTYSQGIKFESRTSWKEVLAKAKTENKYIFIDCYATWCGPCKWMSKNIYPEKEVGDYYNSHFINVSVQMDKTPNDVQSIHDWYADADTIAARYNVQAYPTYLFFAPDGHIVHRFNGTTSDKMEFVAKAKEAMDPERQYYSIMETCDSHKGDSAFLLLALQNALSQSDERHAAGIGDYYLDCLKSPLTKDNCIIMRQVIRSCKKKYERGFSLFLENARQIDELMGDSLYVESTLSEIIYEEATEHYRDGGPVYWKKIKADLSANYPTLSPGIVGIVENIFRSDIAQEIKTNVYKYETPPNDWQDILSRFKRKYPGYEITPLFMERKAKYYAMKRMWIQCAESAYSFLHRYGSQLDAYSRNNISWEFIFMHSNDKRALLEAVKWMKNVVDIKQNRPSVLELPNYIDTYANLLYKVGHKKDAFNWEQKAIEMQAKAIEVQTVLENKKYLISILEDIKTHWETMQKGMPTWEYSLPAS